MIELFKRRVFHFYRREIIILSIFPCDMEIYFVIERVSKLY